MLQFLDDLVSYADPTLTSFSSLTYLYIAILASSLLISFRSRRHAQQENIR